MGESTEGPIEAARRSPLTIQGTEGMVLTYAKCCYPIPGDHIVGFVRSGRGMVIHQENCKNTALLQQVPDEMVHVKWAEDVDSVFPVELTVDVVNERGALAIMSNIIAEEDANIIGIHLEDKDTRQCKLHLVISVGNRKHLARIMRRLRYCSTVLKIARSKIA